MKSNQEKPPAWLDRALQGVPYWIGHRRCLYRGYNLSEGALVAEVCNLIFANLPGDLELRCEVQYSRILKSAQVHTLRDRSRADLVIVDKEVSTGDNLVPKYIIEVKRASAQKNQIGSDLSRLAIVRRLRPGVRTFLLVISESSRPRRFVNEHGHSDQGEPEIQGTGHYYKVRRTWKAGHSFSKPDRAQYACLLEVLPISKKTKRRKAH